jgi:hypothetical protein
MIKPAVHLRCAIGKKFQGCAYAFAGLVHGQPSLVRSDGESRQSETRCRNAGRNRWLIAGPVGARTVVHQGTRRAGVLDEKTEQPFGQILQQCLILHCQPIGFPSLRSRHCSADYARSHRSGHEGEQYSAGCDVNRRFAPCLSA